MNTERLAKQLVDYTLKEAGIPRYYFYKLLQALDKAPCIDSDSIKLTDAFNEPIALQAKYVGNEQIGNAIEGKRGINQKVKERVFRLYGDIGIKTGVDFVRIFPYPHEEGCIGHAKLGADRKTWIPLELIKD